MQPDRIATAFVIAKDGTIFRAFPEVYWAHHLGIKGSINADYNRRSIGIELVNEGFLWKDSFGKLHWMSSTGPIYNGPTVAIKWRGGELWPSYTDAQMEATAWLVRKLLHDFKLPATFAPFLKFSIDFPNKYTICTHHNVRIDKTDLHPGWDQEKFISLVTQKEQLSPETTTII